MRQSRCSFLNAWENTQVARAMTSVFLRNTRWRHGRFHGETKYSMLSMSAAAHQCDVSCYKQFDKKSGHDWKIPCHNTFHDGKTLAIGPDVFIRMAHNDGSVRNHNTFRHARVVVVWTFPLNASKTRSLITGVVITNSAPCNTECSLYTVCCVCACLLTSKCDTCQQNLRMFVLVLMSIPHWLWRYGNIKISTFFYETLPPLPSPLSFRQHAC